ncbi:response regulator transcription factor [Gellertiella hungarica]|uniref:DNA-binding NarL/FixJ family response regulator n=1 Tax=Gellertiella hungarica TaxID=1572859 RepID=A0A7W6J2N8_9HYPH|nr:helix-turn-helix domain-containing protein [Gellertiella hungarica]MBB4063656.1 DNA-binding NarL/FixJ family response regulator [Gellertiella hungarica]
MRIHVDSTSRGESRLTQRQSTIVTLLSDGNSVKEIARLLGISIRTVERHIDVARKSTDTPNIAALVAKAIRQRWIS